MQKRMVADQTIVRGINLIKVRTLEADTENAMLEDLIAIGREGHVVHWQDKHELLQRRELLLRSKFHYEIVVLREIVMLSVYLGDMDSVSTLAKKLEARGDPAMGYFVYRALERLGDSRCEVFLASSSKKGYLPAQKTLAIRQARQSLWPNFISVPLARLRHSVKVFKVARHDPRDLRLR